MSESTTIQELCRLAKHYQKSHNQLITTSWKIDQEIRNTLTPSEKNTLLHRQKMIQAEAEVWQEKYQETLEQLKSLGYRIDNHSPFFFEDIANTSPPSPHS